MSVKSETRVHFFGNNKFSESKNAIVVGNSTYKYNVILASNNADWVSAKDYRTCFPFEQDAKTVAEYYKINKNIKNKFICVPDFLFEIYNENISNSPIITDARSSNMSFELKTEKGALSFTPSTNITYTEFLRKIIASLLLFNKDKIDSNFVSSISSALDEYIILTNDIDFEQDNKLDSEIFYQQPWKPIPDFETIRLNKFGDADKYITKLPKQGKYIIHVFYYNKINEIELMDFITKANPLLSQETICSILDGDKDIILGYKKAFELYINLRNANAIITLKQYNKNKKISRIKSVLTGNEILKIKRSSNTISLNAPCNFEGIVDV